MTVAWPINAKLGREHVHAVRGTTLLGSLCFYAAYVVLRHFPALFLFFQKSFMEIEVVLQQISSDFSVLGTAFGLSCMVFT